MITLFRRLRPDIKPDKILPVSTFDRHRSYNVAPKTVINSDVKLQRDMLINVEGSTCKQNTTVEKSYNRNAHIDSHSNNKFKKW